MWKGSDYVSGVKKKMYVKLIDVGQGKGSQLSVHLAGCVLKAKRARVEQK